MFKSKTSLHLPKEETFHILSGELISTLDKKKHKLLPGDCWM